MRSSGAGRYDRFARQQRGTSTFRVPDSEEVTGNVRALDDDGQLHDDLKNVIGLLTQGNRVQVPRTLQVRTSVNLDAELAPPPAPPSPVAAPIPPPS